MRMRPARRRPNIARLSGFKGAEIARELGAKGLRDFSKDKPALPEDMEYLLDMKPKDLTSYEKMILKNAGYIIPE